jgi:uncharacterized protein (DUF2336 family)
MACDPEPMRTQPLLDELEAALASGPDARRLEMLARIADLFVNGSSHYTQDQIAVFDDVMMRLLDGSDVDARANLAQQIAPIANAPKTVIETLAFDDAIEVARPLLSQSGQISEAEILTSAESMSQQHLAAIAQRNVLSEALTDLLVERGDRNVVQLTVTNPGAHFSDAGLHLLVRRATHDQTLAAEMSRRSDIRQRLAEKAARAERTRLAAEQRNAGATAMGAGDGPADHRASDREAAPDFTSARAEVERQNRIRLIGDVDVYLYARDHKFAETAAALSLLSDTPFEVVERALLDPGAELVLIVAKVAGLSPATSRVVLLLRAADRGMSSDAIEEALASFEHLQLEAAQRVLSFFRVRAKKPAEPRAPPALAANG